GGSSELPNFKNLRKERALMSIKYVALDVHQASTAASVRDQSGRVVRRGVLESTPSEAIGFISSIRRPIHLTFEEGTLAEWSHDLQREAFPFTKREALQRRTRDGILRLLLGISTTAACAK